MGEALGQEEAIAGKVFCGRAGFRFERMIERAGFTRDQFQILNAAWCRPPFNRAPETAEVDFCRQYWEPLVKDRAAKVIVPMGNVPMEALIDETGILSKRGYVWWSDKYDAYILPTVHPSYIMRGNSNWEAAWMYDLRHAVEIAREGWEPLERTYTLDPSPSDAQAWVRQLRRVLAAHPGLYLGTDIETPEKVGQDEDKVDISLGYVAGVIFRIGFAYVDPANGQTYSMTIPWMPSYLEIIQDILTCGAELIFCYRHFDVPRIKAHGLRLGIVRDLQEAWHVLHSDLPKALEHIAPFLCPRQPAWKHLNSGGTAALYNAIDAAVQVEGMLRLRELLQLHGMWNLYEQDFHDLNPILIFMGEQGMPVDNVLRTDASQTCGTLITEVRAKLNVAAKEARPNKIYKRFRPGLESTSITVKEAYCSECGKKATAKHPHFRCGTADGEVPLGQLLARTVEAVGYIEPLDFKPSQKGLIRYAQYMGYKLITRWDKDKGQRVASMDESAVRQYALTYPTDPLWALALDERELNKLLGNYIGRLSTEPTREHTPVRWEPVDFTPKEGEDDTDIPF